MGSSNNVNIGVESDDVLARRGGTQRLAPPEEWKPIVHLAINVLGSADDGGHDLLRWLAQA